MSGALPSGTGLSSPTEPEVSALRASIPSAIDVALAEVRQEIGRAITKFPSWPTDPLHAVAVVGEEAGELTKATLQAVYEPVKSGLSEMREEAIQTAAMAVRFLASLDQYYFEESEQHVVD